MVGVNRCQLTSILDDLATEAGKYIRSKVVALDAEIWSE